MQLYTSPCLSCIFIVYERVAICVCIQKQCVYVNVIICVFVCSSVTHIIWIYIIACVYTIEYICVLSVGISLCVIVWHAAMYVYHVNFFFSFGCTIQLVGSWFPNQGSNPAPPPQWKLRVLTTREIPIQFVLMAYACGALCVAALMCWRVLCILASVPFSYV